MGTFGSTFGDSLVNNSSVLNYIPTKSDAVFWLDGTISGDNMVDKISGKLFPITGKDFPANWVKGIPWKSAATISAPVDDADLIAADLDNFWYTAGVPNQIPVVSFFQDINYAHRMFCGSIDPLFLPVSGKEFSKGRVLDIVLYNTVKTGADLLACQTFFAVPTEITTAVKWVDAAFTGTSTGSKAAPYKSFIAADAGLTANDTVYVKSGNYLESTYFTTNKGAKYEGLGFVRITGGSGYTIYNKVANCSFRRLILKSGAVCDMEVKNFTGQNGVYDKLYFEASGENAVLNGTSGPVINLTNCVFAGTNKYNVKTISNVTLDNCYMANNLVNYNVLFSGGTDMILKHCTINKISKYAPGATSSAYIEFNDCDITGNPFVVPDSAYTGTIKTHYNRMNLDTWEISDVSNYTFTNVRFTHDIQYNEIIGLRAIYTVINQPAVTFKNNILNASINSTDYAGLRINSSTLSVAACQIDISNNVILSKNNTFGLIVIGSEAYAGSASNDKIEGNIYDNRLFAHGHWGDRPTGGSHGILVFMSKKVNVYRNFIEGALAGIVMKDYARTGAEGICNYNLLLNCKGAIESKGYKGLKLYNNVVYNDCYADGIGLYLSPSIDPSLNQYMSNDNDLKNNIVVNLTSADTSTCININASITGTASDYNHYFSTNNDISNIGDGSFAALQATGIEANSINANANLNASLVPAVPLVGTDLGADYNTGLDAATTWGSATTIPVITTKVQPVTWQKGAYIQ